MPPSIVKSLQAERDLVALFDAIARDSGVERAEAILRRIEQTMTNLAAFPRIGRKRGDLDGAPRAFAIWPWLVIYEPIEDDRGILVWRIVDGRRDLPQTILGRPRR
jgi:plasmid stabilization system protein ParE